MRLLKRYLIIEIVIFCLFCLFCLFKVLDSGEARAEQPSPIVDLGWNLFLGASADGLWIPFHQARDLVPAGLTYRFYSLKGEQLSLVGGKPQAMDEPCPDVDIVQFEARPEIHEDLIGISCSWNPMPRPVKITSTEQKTYKQAASQILASFGLTVPNPVLTQVLRVDLDGDGTEEVLVSATHYKDGLMTHQLAGGYSVVFLRRVVNGQVGTVVLHSHVFTTNEPELAWMNEVTAVLDLNGDGRMEVVLTSMYYEGSETLIFDIDNLNFYMALGSGCGL